VVVASDDPSEKASGRGLGILRDEGVEVETLDGECASAARLLNQPFRKHALTGRPHVIFKSAMTIDGKVATQTGDSKWISGEESRRLVHRWRGEVDAICVGIGTALADDPMLTARAEEPQRQPRRVVFDSEGRLPLDSALVRTAHEVPLIVVVSRACTRAAADALRAAGAEVLSVGGANEQERAKNALERLGEAEIRSLLLEGGPRLAGAFLDAGEIDEMRLFMAPIALGGRSARAPFEGEGSESIAASQRAIWMSCERIGEDILIAARLNEW
jgi:diaminohydroxyphosphoribosylaminopyrimidine deaminase/5-amino-6-(5-phosphoribosylamino)uracil reductase